jgi:hypothetical protein
MQYADKNLLAKIIGQSINKLPREHSLSVVAEETKIGYSIAGGQRQITEHTPDISVIH